MTPTGSSDETSKRIDRLNRSFVTEVLILDDVAKSPSGKDLEQIQAERLRDLRAIRDSGDIRAIIRFEKAYLEAELRNLAGNQTHENSLREGIIQMSVIDAKIDHVQDHEAYQLTNERDFQLERNRRGGLPKDEACQSLNSHILRLRNTDRTRMEAGERKLLKERQMNMNRANEIYTGLQREALGLGKAAEKEQGMSLGPEL